MSKVFLAGQEVKIVEIVDFDTEQVAVRDSGGNFSEVLPKELTGNMQEEFDRIAMVHTCMRNLLSRLQPTDGTPGSELEGVRKKLLG